MSAPIQITDSDGNILCNDATRLQAFTLARWADRPVCWGAEIIAPLDSETIEAIGLASNLGGGTVDDATEAFDWLSEKFGYQQALQLCGRA